MKEKTDELHERYYQKFWRLQKNADALSGGVIDVMRQNILNEYKDEYAIMRAADMIEIKRELHSLLVKSDMLTPKRLRFRLFWKRPNRAEDQLNREMAVIVEQFFEKKERVINELIAALSQADEADPREVYEQPEPEAKQSDESANNQSGESDGGEAQAGQETGRRKRKSDRSQSNTGQVPGQMTMDELGHDKAEKTPHDDQSSTGQTDEQGDGKSSAISKKD